jgi:hypothetical protein
MSRLTPRRECRRILSRRLRGILAAALTFALLGSVAPARAGLTITPTFDPSITNDPNAAAIEGTINTAIQTYETLFSNNINVTIYLSEMNSGLGQSEKVLYSTPYNSGTQGSFLASLKAQQAVQPGDTNLATAIANLPNTASNPVTGNTNLAIPTADLKALGLTNFGSVGVIGPDGHSYDGLIGLNTHLTTPGSPGSSLQFSLLSVTEHEIDEVLGLGSSLTQSFQIMPSPEDLYRYASNGTRSYTTSSSAQAFFSLDGSHLLAQFDNQNDGGDWGDWQSNPLPPGVPPKVQDAFATVGSSPTVLNDGGVEVTALNVIGYTLAQSAVPEPSSVTLLGCGMLALSAVVWRSRRRAA